MCCCVKQKTAYELRISDWSSDVCSSDLRNLEIERGVDVLVEVELARLDLLHHRGPGKKLRHRTGAEQRCLGQDGRALGDIRIAITFLQHDLAAAHDDDDRARNAPAFE